jgi:hypothetical protein
MPQARSGRPAVFMDRDGCLIEEMGYLNHPSRVRILPRTAAAVARLNAAGIPALMATNQAGIARGYFSAENLAQITRRPASSRRKAHASMGSTSAPTTRRRAARRTAGCATAESRSRGSSSAPLKSSAWTCHAR